MSESKRKLFTSEQKAKVVLEAVKGFKTTNEIAQEFGVHPTQVNLWKKELLANVSSLFESRRGPKPVNPESDPDRLYAKIGQLNMELDWLKKSRGSASRRTTKLGQSRAGVNVITPMPALDTHSLGCLCTTKAYPGRAE